MFIASNVLIPPLSPPQFDGSHVESVLGLWLSINLELAGGKYTPSLAPTLPLTPRAVSALLAAVVRWVCCKVCYQSCPPNILVHKLCYLMHQLRFSVLVTS